MHGNVSESVQDWYVDRCPGREPMTDPSGPATCSSKVARGGYWHVAAGNWRPVVRKPYELGYLGIGLRLRVARELECVDRGRRNMAGAPIGGHPLGVTL